MAGGAERPDPQTSNAKQSDIPADLPADPTRLAAHEMRSHLAILDGYISMLQDGAAGNLSDRASLFLAEIRARTGALSQLVDDMLEDARFEDGQMHLSRRPIDLRQVTRRAVREARTILPLMHNLHYSEPRSVVRVDADPGRLATVLRNLIDNAIKYSPNGGTIDCSLQLDRDAALICVSDEGIGIEPDQVESVFARFSRGHGHDAVGGVGLGLYICRRLAELHKGSIVAQSRPAGGSEFQLRLPLLG